ncbi:MAG: bifunctional adenosylcobinamide kinase/adenosylcobinamide-phosphate guanylyltransferase [Acetobacteraceae bacterium]|nr:bifunctional adenosylcobinamide kinase/adenosylcobinamide-phosphate guanylyltransferase [Acetobacteraceae bacterium]
MRAPSTRSKAENLSHLTLVLGGARSGKSRHAEALLAAGPSPRLYIATAEAQDDEMRARIAAHRAARDGAGWRTIEAPLAMPAALADAANAPAVVDCLTLWVSNLLLGQHDLAAAGAALDSALDGRTAPTVLVSNEVGMGIVPENALARRFRDEAGRLHQRLAARDDTSLVLMVAGIPVSIK